MIVLAALLVIITIFTVILLIKYRILQAGNSEMAIRLAELVSSLQSLSQGNLCITYRPAPMKRASEVGTKILDDLAYEMQSITAPPVNRVVYVGADPFLEGLACGKALFSRISNGAVAILEIQGKRITSKLRRKGFEQALKECNKNIRFVETKETLANPATTYQETTNLIKEHPDLVGIYVSEGITPPNAAQAIGDMGKKGIITLVAHDITEESAPKLEEGTLQYVLTQDLFFQGYNSVMGIFNYLANGTKPLNPVSLVENDLVSRDNYREYINSSGKYYLNSKFNERKIRPVSHPVKELLIIVVGEEKWTLQQQIKMGVLEAKSELVPYRTKVEWVCVPGQDTINAKPLDIEEYKKFINSLLSKKPDGLVLKISYEGMNEYLNSIAAIPVALATYNAEPFGLRSLISHIDRRAEDINELSSYISQWSHESQQAMTQVTQAMQEVSNGATMLRDKSISGQDAVDSLNTTTIELEEQANIQNSRLISSEKELARLESAADLVHKQTSQMNQVKNELSNTQNTMTGLETNFSQVLKMAKVLVELSEQTTILAINASIQASRVSKEAQGFGVVSTEIRALAARSKKNSEELTNSIASLSEAISQVKTAISITQSSTIKQISELDGAVETVHSCLTEFKKVFEELEAGITQSRKSGKQIASVASEVSSLIHTVVTASEENSASTEEVNATTIEMSGQIQSMSVMTGKMLLIAQTLKSAILHFHTE